MKGIAIICTACFISLFASGQAQPSSVERVVEKFVKGFNDEQFDSVYELFSNSYKSRYPKEVNSRMLGLARRQNGAVISKELIGTEGSKHTYLMNCELGAFQTMIGVDESGLINLFSIKPDEKKKLPGEGKIYPSDNPLKLRWEINLDQKVRAFLSKTGCPGISIGIVRDQTLEFLNYGEAVGGEKTLPSQHSVYDIGSITKTFTALLMSRLAVEKRLSLDDTLGMYIKELPLDKSSIKLRQLLNHTSGLPSMPPVPPGEAAPLDDPFKYYDGKQLLSDIQSVKLLSLPGERFSYSNLGFALLGHVIERVTEQKMTDLVRSHILMPLDMNSTTFDPKSIPRPRLTKGLSAGQIVEYTTLDAMNPAGGLKSSAEDMIKYARSLFDKPSEAVQQTQKITFSDQKGLSVGLGWLNTVVKGRSIYFHNGGTTGYRSFIGVDADSKLAMILLSNSSSDVTQLGFSLLSIQD